MTLFFGCDHAGLELKQKLIKEAQLLGWDVQDLGVHVADPVDYPDVARLVVDQVLKNSDQDFGCLICGTGIGMSIAANRFKGIRAAVCNDSELSAQLGRAHNNANILCLGARIVTEETALACLRVFLATPFEGGRHIARIAKLDL